VATFPVVAAALVPVATERGLSAIARPAPQS
jgi:hypothetical protein